MLLAQLSDELEGLVAKTAPGVVVNLGPFGVRDVRFVLVLVETEGLAGPLAVPARLGFPELGPHDLGDAVQKGLGRHLARILIMLQRVLDGMVHDLAQPHVPAL